MPDATASPTRRPGPPPGRLDDELRGGLVAATLGVTEAIAYAALVFAPLGPAYVPMAVVSGLTSVCLVNFGSAIRHSGAAVISGPYSLASVLLASTLAALLRGPAGGDAPTAIALLMAVCVMAGAMQVALGLVRLGDLARYIPQPVVAGLLNGTALAIAASQVRPILGGGSEQLVESATLATAVVTMAATFLSMRYLTKLPAPLLGVAVGTLAHHGIATALPATPLGPTIGAVSAGLPPLSLSPMLDALHSADPELLLRLSIYAAALAFVLSLRSLITVVAMDQRLHVRSDRNAELVNQGAGNMLAPLLGGIAGAACMSVSVANQEYGGRGRLSRVTAGAFGLLTLLVLGRLVSLLPVAVLSAALVMLCTRTADWPSVRMVAKLLSGDAPTRALGADLLIMLTVTGVLIGVGTLQAVLVGVLIGVLLLLHRLGKDIIRRRLRGGAIFSNVHRADEEFETLLSHGPGIHIAELEGSLFFGTADVLLDEIDRIIDDGGTMVILDLKHVTSMDGSGAHALLRAKRKCAQEQRPLLLSATSGHGVDRDLLRSIGVMNAAQDGCFETMDMALAQAEDRLLDIHLGPDRYAQLRSLGEIEALSAFGDTELQTLTPYLSLQEFADGEGVVEQGAPGDSAHFIVRGRAHVTLRSSQRQGAVVIGTLCPGTMFGAMSILDGRPRSASVVADGELSCHALTLEAFTRLENEHPDLALRLLKGMAQELSKRIRIGNHISSELRG